jgi:leucyl aminopeptidase
MKVELRRGDIRARRAGVVALGIIERGGPLTGAALAVDRATRGAVSSLLKRRDFAGRFLETAILYPRGLASPRLLLVGLGPRAELTTARVRQAAAIAARRSRDLEARTLALVVLGVGAGGLPPEGAAQATAEGLVLGHYRFTAYKTHKGPAPLTTATIVEREADRFRPLSDAVSRGAQFAEGTCFARDLANTPGQDLTPEGLASRAREIAQQSGARVQVFGVPQLERLGMGALLAVGRGSVHPPRFIVLERAPAAARRGGRGGSVPTVVVVGKGVTFDTGGLSLKPRENMHKMKYDMSGAAAVFGLFRALPALDPPLRVVGLVAAAENMPGGRAFKPGDVVRAMDGTSIEITNTDAEGRLVLADALCYAHRYRPDAVVDLATLTGAVSIALGNRAAGLFANDEDLAAELSAAAALSGERLWPLPTWDEYATEMRSDVADLVNSSGTREGGAILGAVFLKHFAHGLKWAHLDIASTAWTDTDRPHEPKGPTGFGVRLLLEWLSRRVSGPGPEPATRVS